MHADLFITIAFVSLVVAFALFGLAVARHERRRDHAAAEQDGVKRPADGDRSSTERRTLSMGHRLLMSSGVDPARVTDRFPHPRSGTHEIGKTVEHHSRHDAIEAPQVQSRDREHELRGAAGRRGA